MSDYRDTEEWKHKEAEREKQEKAFSDSLRTDKTKKEVKWLSNGYTSTTFWFREVNDT